MNVREIDRANMFSAAPAYMHAGGYFMYGHPKSREKRIM